MQTAKKHFRVTALILVLAAFLNSAAHGKETGSSVATDSGYLTFFLDNDLFAGTDENYTNGARISYITEGRPVIDIPFVQENLHRFSADGEGKSFLQRIWGFEDPSKVEYSYGFALTQLMFTPTDEDALTAPPGERPYAGWTGLSLSLHARDENTLNTVEISLGVVGPHARAEEAQNFIHDIRGFDRFEGWDSQVPNEITLNLHFEQKRRWKNLRNVKLPMDLELDGFHETGYSIGTQITGAHLGFLVRLGWNLPIEFSDARLTPTAHTQKLYTNSSGNEEKLSFYIIGGARISAVLHDITLDGPVFRDFDTGVKSKVWVGEAYAGFGVRYIGWELNYVHTYRSKQFEGQKDDQSFGSIAIRKRF